MATSAGTVSISQAARMYEKSRKSIYRILERHSISKNKGQKGETLIQIVDLIAHLGEPVNDGTLDTAGNGNTRERAGTPISTPFNIAFLRQENEFLMKENQRLEDDIRERKSREEKLEAEKTELRKIIQSQTALLPKPENQPVARQKPQSLSRLNTILIGCGVVTTGVLVLVAWVLPHLG